MTWWLRVSHHMDRGHPHDRPHDRNGKRCCPSIYKVTLRVHGNITWDITPLRFFSWPTCLQSAGSLSEAHTVVRYHEKMTTTMAKRLFCCMNSTWRQRQSMKSNCQSVWHPWNPLWQLVGTRINNENRSDIETSSVSLSSSWESVCIRHVCLIYSGVAPSHCAVLTGWFTAKIVLWGREDCFEETRVRVEGWG